MGVSYYTCDCCRESSYEEYVAECCSCNHSVCTQCVVNDDINSDYAYYYGVVYDGTESQKEEYGIIHEDYKIGDIVDDTGIAPKYCPFCAGEAVSDQDVLRYLVKKLALNYEDLVKEYLSNK